MNEALPEGAPALLADLDWAQFDVATASQHQVDALEAAIAPFFLSLSRAEFFSGVTTRGMLGYPLATVEDLASDQQLAARGFWQPVETPWDGELCATGSFALFDGERPPLRRTAPCVGEHNLDVLGRELGLGLDEITTLRSAGVV
jgi:crotonobetainyl-CoA:carnitine CoA-transferase CaiB-like acyl-CoA transferase